MTGSGASPAATPTGQFPDYKLRSDLAQFCLPAANYDRNRKMAWANSVCVAFLVIGIIGIKTRPIEVKEVEKIAEVVPVIFTPPDTPPPTTTESVEEPPERTTDAISEAPVIATVVAADPTTVNFAVPVEGPVVFAPAKFAAAPPADPPKAVAPPKPVLFNSKSEDSGSFPQPPYPADALRRGSQGKVMLYVIVAADGSLDKVEVKDGSGFQILDNHSVSWVKRNWRFPAGQVRHYHVPFIYQIK